MAMTHQDKVTHAKIKALKNSINHYKDHEKCDKCINIPSFNEDNEDRVNHPSHYTWLKEKCGIEVIDITRHLDFNTGNAVKYLLRAGYKKEEGFSIKEKTIEDLEKAIFYIKDKIKLLKEG